MCFAKKGGLHMAKLREDTLTVLKNLRINFRVKIFKFAKNEGPAY